jgi:hypothetical protein
MPGQPIEVEVIGALAAALCAALLLAVPAESAFEPWFQERGVAVAKAAQADSELPWIRGVAELEASPAQVEKVLADFGAYKAIFDPILASAEVLGTEGGTTRMHLVWGYPWPLRDRDAIVAHTLQTHPDGTVVLEWKGDARPGDPQTGVRIQVVEGRTEVVPRASGGSRLTYTYYGDLGGDFGQGANEKAWHNQPLHYVEALRKLLAKR